jgi:hypothetical protein
MMDNALQDLMYSISTSVIEDKFVKLTLSKPKNKQSDLKNVYVKMILLKGSNWLSFTYKHNTKDIVKNFAIEDALQQLIGLLDTSFFAANLLTSDMDIALLSNEKGSLKLIKRPVDKRAIPEREHDHAKSRLINPSNSWWFQLGITDRQGNVLPSMQFKFKQINKYVEILDGLIKQIDFQGTVKVVDMGAGKAYLTFALYEYLVINRKLDVQITGVEQRPDLVEKTNRISRSANLENLRFVEGMIGNFAVKEMDVLIALHACDTATDDAIAAGIKAGAQLIVCAPCCHKQIRQTMKPPFDALPMLKFGILLERQAEILTDTIRALLMEKHGYKSQIMEFIETEHTPKNLLITGIRTTKNIDIEDVDQKIDSLKKQFGIEKHYLETVLG